jgi:hypothetical protein
MEVALPWWQVAIIGCPMAVKKWVVIAFLQRIQIYTISM